MKDVIWEPTKDFLENSRIALFMKKHRCDKELE